MGNVRPSGCPARSVPVDLRARRQRARGAVARRRGGSSRRDPRRLAVETVRIDPEAAPCRWDGTNVAHWVDWPPSRATARGLLNGWLQATLQGQVDLSQQGLQP